MRIRYSVSRLDGTINFYRAGGVLEKLRYLDPSVSVSATPKVAWCFIMDADILFLANPTDYEWLKAASIAKEFGVKVWVDYDDNILNVGPHHPRCKEFNDPNRKQCIWNCLKLADIVTVSTQAIKDEFEKYNNNIIVIPNAFNDYNYKLPEQAGNNRVVNWRGGDTHYYDLLTVRDEIMKLADKYPEWLWNFFGDEKDIRHVINDMTTAACTGILDHLQYIVYAKKMRPAIQIHPLEVNEFNLAKSNIAWLEGMQYGAVSVMPKMPEFIRPGILNYDTPDEFEAIMTRMMEDDAEQIELFKESKAFIEKNLLLSNVNKQRLEVARSLA